MPHDHNHEHGHTCHVPSVTQENERKTLISFLLIFIFMIMEAVGGYLSGSLALLADAGHMLTDAAALALACLAFRFGRQVADQKRTFGYLRFEVLAGLANAVLLFAIVGWILVEAYDRLQAPAPVLAGPMLVIAIIGLIVNIVVLWILTRGDSEHINVKGAILHVMGDLLGSVGAIAAAIIINLTGWTPIDPILSVLVSLLVLHSAWKLLQKSLHILLEGAPENMSPEDIKSHLMQTIPGLASVQHVHIWMITSGKTLATLHISPRDNAQARALTESVEQELKSHFHLTHTTIAIDWKKVEDGCLL